MSSLMERMMKSGTIKGSSILNESEILNNKDYIPTELPILNVAFSGDINGGMNTGVTILSGDTQCYKSLLGLYCVKAYMDQYTDAVCLFFDSEFGITDEYLKSQGIDSSRVLHIPIDNIENLKFDMVSRLNEVKRGDKVIFFVDSIGMLPSKKEIDDANDEKSVADMTRAKSLRSLFRLVTPSFSIKDIPCIFIAHAYSTMELYSKKIVGGGTAIKYSANQVFIITKAQEKDGTDLLGWNFTINIEKSRYVREKSKMVFTVTYEDGVQKYSGLIDIAVESGLVVRQGIKFYHVDQSTGEIVLETGTKAKNLNTPEFWTPILNNEVFQNYVRTKFRLGKSESIDIIEEEEENNNE